jgi:3-oxoacyl-[acyl-carrier protein] reductase
MHAVNVRSAIQAATRYTPEGGRVITIGSVVAQRTFFPSTDVYTMTKSALAVMVRGVAQDLVSRGITVNNVQPGPTATDMNPPDGTHSEAVKSMCRSRGLASTTRSPASSPIWQVRRHP